MPRNETTAQRRAKNEKVARDAGYRNYDAQQFAKRYGDDILNKPWVKNDDTPGYHYPMESIYTNIKNKSNSLKDSYLSYLKELEKQKMNRRK